MSEEFSRPKFIMKTMKDVLVGAIRGQHNQGGKVRETLGLNKDIPTSVYGNIMHGPGSAEDVLAYMRSTNVSPEDIVGNYPEVFISNFCVGTILI